MLINFHSDITQAASAGPVFKLQLNSTPVLLRKSVQNKNCSILAAI